jgi:hypothetical protein
MITTKGRKIKAAWIYKLSGIPILRMETRNPEVTAKRMTIRATKRDFIIAKTFGFMLFLLVIPSFSLVGLRK